MDTRTKWQNARLANHQPTTIQGIAEYDEAMADPVTKLAATVILCRLEKETS